MPTPKLETSKSFLDQILLRLVYWWFTSGWLPQFTKSRKKRRLKQVNREAVDEVLSELEKEK